MRLYFLTLMLAASSLFAAEPPYKQGELKDVFALTDSQLRSSVSEIKQLKAAKRQPKGANFECYMSGVATIDFWLSIPVRIQKTPPTDAPSYYQFVYSDGYPVALYRHEKGNVQLSDAYYYDEKSVFPKLAVNFDKNNKPFSYGLLTYDSAGRIKRVVIFDSDYKPLRATCFTFTGEPGVVESRGYSLIGGGQTLSHRVETPDASYQVTDGQRIKQNVKLRSSYVADFKKHGIKPFYPEPSL